MKKKIVLILFIIVMALSTKVIATVPLSQLQSTYYNGSKWTDTYIGYSLIDGIEYKMNANKCAVFAALMYYSYYGIDPYASAEIVYDVEQVKPGDIVRYSNDGHSVWVLSRNGENVQVAECNYDLNCSVRWYQNKTMSELRNGFNYIYKAPYVLGGSEPELTEPSGIKATLKDGKISVSWNRPVMASGYTVKIFSAEDVAQKNFSNPIKKQEIKFPSITSTSFYFNETGDFYVYVYTKRGEKVSANGGNGVKLSLRPITSVTISSDETGNMVVGDKRKYTASFYPTDTTTQNKTITWSTENESIASVNKDGLVTALKSGSTYLYAKASNGVSEKVLIDVTYTKVPITYVDINGGTQSIRASQHTQLTATIYPQNATGDKTIKWTTDDESVAKVDSNGLVTGVGEGKTRIRATSVNGMTRSWIMNVLPEIKVSDVTLSKTNIELVKGNLEKIKATIIPYNATNRNVVWSSSNEKVATVDDNGNITAVSKGNAIITAKVGNISKICNVSVYEININLSPEDKYVFTDLLTTLQLNAKLSNSEDAEFEWKSSNNKILKVDKNGKVTPISGGFADIIVTNSKYNISSVCSCFVRLPITLSDGSKAYLGDMNKDGFYNAIDSSMILDAFNRGATADEILIGDVNGDGFVNAADSSVILDLYKSGKFAPGSYKDIQTHISKLNVQVSQTDVVYTGKKITRGITVKDGTKTLVKGTDYTVTYKNNVNIGTASVILTGKGNYTGTVTKTFKIVEGANYIDFTKLKIQVSQTDVVYTGNKITRGITVKDGAKTLVKGTDYTVTYKNNVNIGTASVILTGKGKYIGKVTKTFNIVK